MFSSVSIYIRYLLACCHALYCMVSPIQCVRMCWFIIKLNRMKRNKEEHLDYFCVAQSVLFFSLKYIFNPILVGFVLYGEHILGEEQGVRVAIAISIVTTSYLFLGSISRFPFIGRYTNMLTKVCAFIASGKSYYFPPEYSNFKKFKSIKT